MNDVYTVLVIDGGLMERVEDVTTPSLKYADCSWSEASELCRLSFRNGYRCVIWQQGGTDEQPEKAVPKKEL